MDEYYVDLPEISVVRITPNPANTGQRVLVSVTAQIVRRQVFPELRYAGEIYAGDDK